MSRLIAIGDIHGCRKTLKHLLKKLKITTNDKIYCIGDYIDRGPNSKGVVDLILNLRQKGYNIHTLRGNHEELMMNSIKGKREFNLWMSNGGETTLKSFGISSFHELKPIYKKFFKRTKYFIVKKDYLFSHAGFNLNRDNIFEDKRAMLWMRDLSSEKNTLENRVIIHGHTPKNLSLIKKNQDSKIINIDGGCPFIEEYGLGNLIGIDLTNKKIYIQKNIDS